MPLYLTQVAYTPEACKALVNNPQNRIEAGRPAVEKLGGKIVSGYFAFGNYDIVPIVDMLITWPLRQSPSRSPQARDAP